MPAQAPLCSGYETASTMHKISSTWQQISSALNARMPQFDAISSQAKWGGHDAHNTFDQNVIIAAHTHVENFFFLNDFSGHRRQQPSATARGTVKIMMHREHRSLDTPLFSFEWIGTKLPIIEKAIILWR